MASILAAGLARSTIGESVQAAMQHDTDEVQEISEEKRPQVTHGRRTKKSESIGFCFTNTGNERQERIYKSNTREPLGKPFIRGYTLPAANHEYGVRRITSENKMKDILFPPESEESFIRRKAHEENKIVNIPNLPTKMHVGSDSHSVAEAFDWKVHIPDQVSDRWKAYHAATENVVGRHRGFF